MANKSILDKIEESRKELLDLSLRNPLLNYRSLRARGVDIVGESASQVFNLLVTQGKAMSFLPDLGAEEEVEGAEQFSLQIAQPEDAAQRGYTANQSDRSLQTSQTSENLHKRLLNSYRLANTSIEETGVNTLFIALGVLCWYEADQSQDERRAPLVLIPVQLQREGIRQNFRVTYTGEDIGANLSLIEKARADFGLLLPTQDVVDEVTEGRLSVGHYLDVVDQMVRQSVLHRWRVDQNSVILGFFSYNKLQLFRDLDDSAWPDGAGIAENSIVSGLFGDGFSEPAPIIPHNAHLDAHLNPNNTYHVLDADSSQSLAIHEANSGRNLVIQGPPGTGKSQTIANIIAEGIASGKRVLFVAEKMAALEVVKRRLDNIGLGQACLELHSHKTNKRAILNELDRTLKDGNCNSNVVVVFPAAELAGTRLELNDYAEGVNTPVGASGVTPNDAFGKLLAISESVAGAGSLNPLSWERISGSDSNMNNWSDADFNRKKEVVEELRLRLQRAGVPANHPFWGCRLRSLSPAGQASLAERINSASHALESLVAPECRFQVKQVKELLDDGFRWNRLHSKYDAVMLPEAWNSHLESARHVLNTKGRSFWRSLFSSDYWKSRDQLAAVLRIKLPDNVDRQIQLIDTISAERQLRASITRQHAIAKLALGDNWAGLNTDWDQLSRALNTYLACAKELESALEMSNEVGFGDADGLISLTFSEQKQTLIEWARRLPEIQDLIGLNVGCEAALSEDLREVVAVSEQHPDAVECLTEWFDRAWYESIVETAFVERPTLRDFDGRVHEARFGRFRALDQHSLVHNRNRVVAAHSDRLSEVKSLPDRLPRQRAEEGRESETERLRQRVQQLRVLQREIQKKSRHKPIRRLVAEAGGVIQDLKPVFMMSPLSIANYLPPGSADFDLVVYDEASQVRPVDALGALLRAEKAVVVGDSKQLPPTHFFEHVNQADDDADDEGSSETADIESILGLFSAKGAPSRDLRWHYRSRHESLIALSNREFYENNLVVFPSPDAGREAAGLRFHHLPEAVFDRGKSGTNLQEAENVARAVMEHATSDPELSLGVAAFGIRQAQAIQDRLELLRRQDDSCEEFFAGHPEEPFFVKNLENVQGDERDVIFISIGYGRDANGQVSMNFGPLNQSGGERRLNVLITRAKLQCHVFTNLRGEDIDLDRTESIGVRVLKAFLDYSATGILPQDVPFESSFHVDSPFQQEVARRLRKQGYQVHDEVAIAGKFIDIGIVDPEKPGRYLIGIECDGASYHSARSARDRDRLRQRVLEGLGWKLHRVWSTDWFRNPERELMRAVAAIEAAKTVMG